VRVVYERKAHTCERCYGRRSGSRRSRGSHFLFVFTSLLPACLLLGICVHWFLPFVNLIDTWRITSSYAQDSLSMSMKQRSKYHNSREVYKSSSMITSLSFTPNQSPKTSIPIKVAVAPCSYVRCETHPTLVLPINSPPVFTSLVALIVDTCPRTEKSHMISSSSMYARYPEKNSTGKRNSSEQPCSQNHNLRKVPASTARTTVSLP
jgi:hypothetical protein